MDKGRAVFKGQREICPWKFSTIWLLSLVLSCSSWWETWKRKNRRKKRVSVDSRICWIHSVTELFFARPVTVFGVFKSIGFWGFTLAIRLSGAGNFAKREAGLVFKYPQSASNDQNARRTRSLLTSNVFALILSLTFTIMDTCAISLFQHDR